MSGVTKSISNNKGHWARLGSKRWQSVNFETVRSKSTKLQQRLQGADCSEVAVEQRSRRGGEEVALRWLGFTVVGWLGGLASCVRIVYDCFSLF
ncbi:hypothetical protein CISIN_1g034475mg [Citrus sinensis]|uniref:Uncharacterized protein n=1 Tax=Citrus sinensis TaxID=2711 RepID=A0A067DAZ8_CITSI|nr:hypothetical protein CISIN_1g034475mg [Citrus sinensis]